jgi:hypothetical protein
MTEPTHADRARAVGSAAATGAALVGVVVASALDHGVPAGEAVVGTIVLLTVIAAPAAPIVALLLSMAPGEAGLSRDERARVNRAIRLGTSIDESRLAPSTVRRADQVAQRLEKGPRRLQGIVTLVVVLLAGGAVARIIGGDYWQAVAAVVLAAVVAGQRHYWEAALERQRDRALVAGVSAIKLLVPAA